VTSPTNWTLRTGVPLKQKDNGEDRSRVSTLRTGVRRKD